MGHGDPFSPNLRRLAFPDTFRLKIRYGTRTNPSFSWIFCHNWHFKLLENWHDCYQKGKFSMTCIDCKDSKVPFSSGTSWPTFIMDFYYMTFSFIPSLQCNNTTLLSMQYEYGQKRRIKLGHFRRRLVRMGGVLSDGR